MKILLLVVFVFMGCESVNEDHVDRGEGDSGQQPDSAVSPDQGVDVDAGPAPDSTPPTDKGMGCQDENRQERACGPEMMGSQIRRCDDGQWSAWSECDLVCADGDVEEQGCGQGGDGVQRRTCTDGTWPVWSPCEDPNESCEPGAIETVLCGLNRRGRQEHACGDEARWSDFGPCNDPDVCIDGTNDASACGINGRGERVLTCVEGQWSDGECADADICVDDAVEVSPCGLNDAGQATRTCTQGNWSEPHCEDGDVCLNGAREEEPCGIEGNGTRTHNCVDGQWGEFGVCDDPDRMCEDGSIETVPCGINRRGEQSHACEAGHWEDLSACEDPDVCVDDAEQEQACGFNDSGRRTRTCRIGAWRSWRACDDPDICQNGMAQDEVCGLNQRGDHGRVCQAGQWTMWAPCLDPDVCIDDAVEQRPCGDEGEQQRICFDGHWGQFSACEEPDFCALNPDRCAQCLDHLDPNDTPETATRLDNDTAAKELEILINNMVLCDNADPVDYFHITSPEWPTFTDIFISKATPDGSISLEGLPVIRPEFELISSGAFRTHQEPIEFAIRADEAPQPVSYLLYAEQIAIPVCGYTNNPNCLPCQDDLEPNNENEEATAGELGRVYANLGLCGGNLGDPADIFSFPMRARREYTLAIKPQFLRQIGPVDISVYDQNGRPIPTDRLGIDQWSRQFQAPSTGRFFVSISTTTGLFQYWLLATDQPLSECFDGVDNDGDGRIDTLDSGCTEWMDNDESDDRLTSCSNGIDNDRDGQDGIMDVSCRFQGADTELTVENGCLLTSIPIFTGRTDRSASTQNGSNHRRASCGAGAGSPDVAYVFHIDEPSTLRAETSADFDTVLHLSRGCGEDLEEIACDDDGGAVLGTSRLEIDLQPGAYTLFLDGYSNNSMGQYSLGINIDPTP